MRKKNSANQRGSASAKNALDAHWYAIESALHAAANDAVLMHKRLGLPMVEWIDEKIAWTSADELVVDKTILPKSIANADSPQFLQAFYSAIAPLFSQLTAMQVHQFIELKADLKTLQQLHILDEKAASSELSDDEQLEDFRGRIRIDLLSNLAEIRRSRESNWSSDESADDYMQPFIDSLSLLKDEVSDDSSLVTKIEQQIERTQEWISNNMDEDRDRGRSARPLSDVGWPHESSGIRSIFDDIDE